MKLASGKNVEEALYAFLGFDVGFRVQALTTQQSGEEPQQGEVLAGHLCGHTIVRWGTLYEASSEPPPPQHTPSLSAFPQVQSVSSNSTWRWAEKHYVKNPVVMVPTLLTINV